MVRIITLIVFVSAMLTFTAFAGDFVVGVGTHVMGQDPSKNLGLLRDLNAGSLRDDLKWQLVETSRSNFSIPPKLQNYIDAASGYGLEPLMVLVYGNTLYDDGKKPVSAGAVGAYGDFARFAATESGHGVRFFEIWNEWDHDPEPKSPESYLQLVKKAALAIREVTGNAKILAGAATTAGMRDGWAERLVRLGVLDYVDGISIHPYVHCDRDNSPEAWMKFLSLFSGKLRDANGGREVPLFITEMGWPSHRGACGVTEETAAQYAARALLLARTVPAVKGFWWYDLKNDGKDPSNREQNFGLLGYDYSPKPAFAAFRDVAPVVVGASGATVTPAPAGLKLLELLSGNGGRTFALWSEDGTKGRAFVTLTGSGPFRLLHAGSGDTAALPVGKKVPIPLDGFPQIVTGAATLAVDSFIPSR